MFDLRMIGAVSAMTLLAACGGGGDETSKDVVAEGTSTEVAESRAKKPDTKQPNRPIQDPEKIGLSFEGYLALEVQGVKPMMTIDEVRTALAEKGYTVGPVSRFGSNCSTCKPGHYQKRANIIVTPDGKHELTPFFFVDEDGTERLWGLRYERDFDDPVYPPNMQAAFEERFGEPTFAFTGRYKDTDPDTIYTKMDYSLNMRLPDGQSIDDTEQDYLKVIANSNVLGASVADADDRGDCWKKKLERQEKDYNVEAMKAQGLDDEWIEKVTNNTPWCSFVMSMEPQPTDWFFGARYNTEVLQVLVKAKFMKIELSGHFLHNGERSAERVREYQAKLEAAEAMKARKPTSIDDL